MRIIIQRGNQWMYFEWGDFLWILASAFALGMAAGAVWMYLS